MSVADTWRDDARMPPINRVPGPHEDFTVSSYDTVPRQPVGPRVAPVGSPTRVAAGKGNGWRLATVALGVMLVLALVGVALALRSRAEQVQGASTLPAVLSPTTVGPTTSVPPSSEVVSVMSVAPAVPATTEHASAPVGAAPVVTSQVVTAPSAPTITSWAEAGAGKVSLKVQPPASWGNSASGVRTLEYRASGGFALFGGWIALPADGVISLGGSCQNYSVEVRATNERFSSVPSAKATVTVYAPPPAPLIKATVIGATIKWERVMLMSIPEAPHECPYTVTAKVDGVATAFGTFTYGYSQTHTLVATATDSRGNTTTSSIQATTDPAPPPAAAVSISRGAFTTSTTSGCAVGACKWVNISTSGWSAGQALTITCSSAIGSVGPFTRYADGSGNFSANNLCAYGTIFDVYVVVNGVKSNTVSPWKDW